MIQMFERETRREKILEARNKELRLKEKTKGILGLGGAVLVRQKLILFTQNALSFKVSHALHLKQGNMGANENAGGGAFSNLALAKLKSDQGNKDSLVSMDSVEADEPTQLGRGNYSEQVNILV